MLGTVLHAFSLGGVFGTLREPQGSLVTFGREGMRRFPAFLVFTFAALAAALAAYRWIWIESGEALKSRVQQLDTEFQALAVTGIRLLVLLLVLAAIKLIADSVRAIWVSRPDLPPISRFFAGVAGALSRPARLFGVLALYVVVTLLLYAIWIWADPPAGGEARFALVPLILTQQVFVFVRLLVKVGYYAGVSEALLRDRSPEYSYVPAAATSAEARARDESPLDDASSPV
jgi:predicted small integral membrane protein